VTTSMYADSCNHCIASQIGITCQRRFMYLMPSSLGSKVNHMMRASLLICSCYGRDGQVGHAC
jgi:hypothetical protein